MRLLIFGPPGAGKGTVAKRITEDLGIPHISTGDMLRAAIAAGSELGRRVKDVLDAGALVSDETMIELVDDRLSADDAATGWLLDGFPRTLPQAEALDTLLGRLGQSLDRVVMVETEDETIVARLGGRRVCGDCGATYHLEFAPTKVTDTCDVCGKPVIQREDDLPETVQRRLMTYHAQTAPLVDYYEQQGLVQRFDNSGSPAETVSRVKEALAAVKPGRSR